MAKILQERISKHVLWASINRPEARNAVDFEVMDELESLALQVEQNDEIRIFILTGTGTEAFVSGGDLRKFHSIKSEEKAVEMSHRMHQILNRIEDLPCWTIAFVNGDAYGGGIELMLAFDFRLSVPDVKLGFTQGRFYLVPGWGGLTRLSEKIGRAKALELLGKSKVISAEKALDIGLVDYILTGKSSKNELLQWSEKLIQNDRKFIQTLKKGSLLYSKSRAEALKGEIAPFAKLWVDDEHEARVQKFLNKDKDKKSL